ncbi:CU044_2847 family protein [Streptomyces peucetius]
MKDAEIVELDLPGGGRVLVRASQVHGDTAAVEFDEGPANVGLREALSFSAVSSAIRGVASEVHRALETAAPDVAEVELGFEMALKGSRMVCLLVDSEAKATIRVRLEWHKGAPAAGQ